MNMHRFNSYEYISVNTLSYALIVHNIAIASYFASTVLVDHTNVNHTILHGNVAPYIYVVVQMIYTKQLITDV